MPDWIRTSVDFPTWKETGHIEARMRDGTIRKGWIVGHDTDQGDSIFEFELDGSGFGVLSDIVEYRSLD